jgi:hypothetical protein
MQVDNPPRTKAQAECATPMSHPDESLAASTYFQRNNWSKALTADRSQKTTARLIGGALGRRFKVGAGGICTCIVSYDDLAEDAGCGRSTAIIGVAQLREGGWLAPATSQGRAANNFTLLMPSNGVNIYPAKHTANGVTVHTPLKNNLQEDKIKQESQKGHWPALALSMTRESNGRNAANGASENDAPIAPAFNSGIDAALHVPKQRETAVAARLIQHDAYLHHEHRPESSSVAPSSIEMDRGARRNGGKNGKAIVSPPFSEPVQQLQWIEPPNMREPQSCLELVFGVGR